MSEMNSEIPAVVDPVLPEPEEGSRKKGLIWRIREIPAWFAALTQRQRLMAAIIAVAAALLLILATLIWYLIFRRPLSDLPGLNLMVPPKYSYSIGNTSRPLGVAIDESNNRVYVTQSEGARTVAVFDIEGNPLGTLVPNDPNVGHTPTYVAVDPTTKNVYVTDRGSSKIYVYDSTGKFLDTFGPAGVKRFAPLGITIDDQGLIYVTDVATAKHRILVLKADGTVVRTEGEQYGLRYPNGLAVLDNGSLAVADSNNARVVVFDSNGVPVGTLARGDADAPMGLPRGLATGANGRLYVVDTVNAVVRIYRQTSDGLAEYGASFGEAGDIEGTFSFPNGIATDSHGHIFVTDRANNRVEVWTNP